MPELRHLTRAKVVEATIELGDGDSMTMSFDANKVTPRWMDEAMQRIADQDMLTLAKALSEVMVAWDVTDEGNPFPPSKENISLLSFPVINNLFETVCKSAAPTSEEGNGSETISSTPPSVSSSMPDSPPNGQSPSTSPVPSASQPVT